jgi:predicted GNAT family N-acyltransferase
MNRENDIVVKRAEGDEIDVCFQIRREVFIEEQKVSEEDERDNLDASAIHFIVYKKARPIATARVVLIDEGKTGKIGRVAVLKSERSAGIGSLLMSAMEESPDLRGLSCLALGSQTHAVPFYEKLGYKTYGKEYMDAGIPHLHMKKELNGKR